MSNGFTKFFKRVTFKLQNYLCFPLIVIVHFFHSISNVTTTCKFCGEIVNVDSGYSNTKINKIILIALCDDYISSIL